MSAPDGVEGFSSTAALFADVDQQAADETAEQRRDDESQWPLETMTSKAVSDTPPEPDWLLKLSGSGYLQRGKVCLFTAPGGTGKSFAAVGLGLAVATEKAWLRPGAWSDRKNYPKGNKLPEIPKGIEVTKPGHVVLILGEEEPEDAKRRIHYTAKMMGLKPGELDSGRLHVMSLAGKSPRLIRSDKGGQAARSTLYESLFRRLENLTPEGLALVVIDPLARFAGPDAEVSPDAATAFMEAMEALTQLEGRPSVLVLHHERKSGGSGASAARGTTALVDAPRAALRLKRIVRKAPSGSNQEDVWLEVDGHRALWLLNTKANNGPLGKPMMLVIDSKHNGAVRAAATGEVESIKALLAPKASSSKGSAGPDKPRSRNPYAK